MKTKTKRDTRKPVNITADSTISINGVEFHVWRGSGVYQNRDFSKRIKCKDKIFTAQKNHNVDFAFWENGEFSVHAHTNLSDLKKLVKTAEKSYKRFKKARPDLPTGFFLHFGNISFFVNGK
jgi:hypothetical protein